MTDGLGRSIEYARLSITDRCNLRCVYCMPEEGAECLSHGDILSFEELTRVTRLMTALGVHAARVTGGEPMVRRGCLDFVRMLREIPALDRISMTTNGTLLKGRVAEAKAAGLTDMNISLDTLNPAVFRQITRFGKVEDVLAVIHEAVGLGMKVKLNAVPLRGLNEEGLTELAALARELPVEVRFIELMPFGRLVEKRFISNEEIRRKVEDAFGMLRPDGERHGMGPAVYGKPEGFRGSIGFISAMSHEFCNQCNRVRVTPEGFLKLCLNRQSGIDLRSLLRGGSSDEEITAAMREAVLRKPERHGFSEMPADREQRRMYQIGG